MTNDRHKEILAANIKKYMERKGVTNHQICDALGFKYNTFLDWIHADTYPRMPKIEAMANYFGIKKSDLIEEKENKKPTEDDGLSENIKALMDFVKTVPEDKAELVLKLMRTIVEDD